MNKRIQILLADRDSIAHTTKEQVDKLNEQLQAEYNKVFDDSKELTKAIANAEHASEYQTNRYGEIESWYRYSGLSEYTDCREFFETWLQDNYCMGVDWNNECLLLNRGDDNLIIQDDTRYGRDNGVWQNGKLIIEERDYRDGDEYGERLGDVNIEKRNALIEAHMERTGYFPGVFRSDQHGNVFYVNTKKKGAS